MTKRSSYPIACGILAAALANAQAPVLPQTYSFSATSNMMGPMSITVNRNGAKEVVELKGATGGFHVRQLYDFQAHKVHTVDLNGNRCTTQQYTSPYAPQMHDPIGGAEEIAREAGKMRAIGRESVNGIATKIVAPPISEGEGTFKIWLDEKFSFPVKQSMKRGAGAETLLFEMRQLSYAPSPAPMFAQPAGCVAVAGTTNANGGSAEMSIGVTAEGRAELGGGGGRAAARAPQTGGNVLLGKWDFRGKDPEGKEWTGEITITKLQPNSFDSADYSNECDINLNSGNAGKGMAGPCLYEARTRKFSFFGGQDTTKFSFNGVLSPDGKSLTGGVWTEAGAGGGTWSASAKAAAARRR